MDAILGKGMSAKQSGVFIAVIAFVLALLGLLNVLSATLVEAMQDDQMLSKLFIKQSFSVLIAMGVCRFFATTDYRRVVALAPRILLVTWIGLILVLLIGTKANGARRWINLGFYSIQVSEFAKFTVILFCAHYASVRAKVIHDFRHGFLPAAICLCITVLLVAREPDFGTSMFLMVIGFMVLFLGGMRLRHILACALIALPPFVFLMLQNFAHIQKRLDSFGSSPHPQVRSAILAMGNGGVMGTGVGQGRSQLDFVPFVESDFVFASVGEQLGFLGSAAVIVLFLLFFWHGLKIAMRARDRAGFLMAFGLTFTVVFQAGINMAVVTGLVPPKGIGLPFVSYGGSSLFVLGAAVGTLLNIASDSREESLPDEEDSEEQDEYEYEESGLKISGIDLE
ncbi:MAG: cell division protein FtsW [Planctomycetota bacterium]|jgi:cell division protein FtsW